MNEVVFLGGCPVVKPEGIYVNGRRVIRLGLEGTLGDVGDLLAYRQEWEPFISAHLSMWRSMNEVLENNAVAKECPAGIFDASQIPNIQNNPSLGSFCSALSLTRRRISDTDKGGGILPAWNAWKDKSSAEVLAGASTMLKDHQDVVMRVGGPYKSELANIASVWNIPLQFPDLPSFSTQQAIRARIEGAYISTKGVIQLLGYSAGELLSEARDLADATAKGLTDTAKELPNTFRNVAIAVAVTAVVVGGVLIVFYKPRGPSPQRSPFQRT